MNVRIRWSFYLLRFKDVEGTHMYIEKAVKIRICTGIRGFDIIISITYH